MGHRTNATVARRHWRGLPWVQVGLVLSTAYLAWSAVAQWQVREVVQDTLAAQGAPAAAVLVTPTAFNTVLWRVVAMHGDGRYDEGFRSLLDDHPLRLRRYPVQPGLRAELAGVPAVQQLARFTQGFYKVHNQTVDGVRQATITDLRMGQEPHYTFSFVVAGASTSVAALPLPFPLPGWPLPSP